MVRNKVIALVVPSLKTGGMERVCVLLANYFSEKSNLIIHLITFSSSGSDFLISSKVHLHQPEFSTSGMSFFQATYNATRFLRSLFKEINPYSILSFGDRYNSLVIMSSIGLPAKVYVSNRMNPSLSNGFVVDTLNFIFYRFAAGIVAQTNQAKKIFIKRYNNRNIKAIPNPFNPVNLVEESRKEVILNIGRFGDQKNQHLLIRYFNELPTGEWELLFLGDGHKKELINQELQRTPKDKKITLSGFVKNVEDYYKEASIFAFTSVSEGFPNALGEAMAGGCACISFDCQTGPSELIDDGINGFLIPIDDHVNYKKKLQTLMQDQELRLKFGIAAREKMKKFSSGIIAEQFLQFITK